MSTTAKTTPPIPDPSDRSLLGLVALGMSEGRLDRYAPEHRQYLEGLNARDPLRWTPEEKVWAEGWHKVCDAAKSPGRRLAKLNDERARRDARRTLDAEERPSTKAALVFDGEERLDAIEWLVEGLIPAEGAGELFGESNIGKTFLAVDLGVHVGAEKDWMGRAVKRGTVLFVESEGTRAFALRKHAAKGAAGLGDQIESNLFALPFATIYQPLAFGPDTDVAEAMSYALSIRAAVEARELPPIRLVVVDTFSQNIAGDADNNAEAQAFLRVFRAFLKALSEGPVFGLLIHHPGHEEKKRGRGAYAIEADLDLVMFLTGTPEALTLSCKRMRDEAPFAPIGLRLERRVITVDGRPLPGATSLVVAAREPGTTEPARDEVETAVLEALPAFPEKEGIEAAIAPKVEAILGRAVDVKTVRTKCWGLERRGLAEKGSGRQPGSYRWGRTQPTTPSEETEGGEM